MKPYFYEGNERGYHDLDAFSYSAGRRLLESPAHCRAYLDEAFESSPSMVFGSAFHARMLEPGKWKRYQVKLDGRTNQGKAQLTEVGKDFLLFQEQMDDIEKMADAIECRPALRHYLSKATEKEKALVWTDEMGLVNKARLDAYPILIDIKTTRDASPRGFKRAVLNYRYDLQIAHYLDGLRACGVECTDHLIIAVQSKPALAAGYVIPDEVLDIAREELKRLKVLWQHCHETKSWPGYEEISDLWFGEFDLKRLRGEYGESASPGGGDTEPDSDGDYGFAA